MSDATMSAEDGTAAPPEHPEAAPAPASGAAALQGRLQDAVGAGTLGPGGRGRAGMLDVPVVMRAVLGEARLPVMDFIDLAEGDTLPLERMIGESIDVSVNDTVVARGEIVLLDEETGQLGVRIETLVE